MAGTSGSPTRYHSRAEMNMVLAEMKKADKPTRPVEADLDVLDDLAGAQGLHGDGWCRPMDIGGSDTSNHSYRLTRLVHAGLAEQRQRGTISGGRRGSKLYRINAEGRRVAARRQGAHEGMTENDANG